MKKIGIEIYCNDCNETTRYEDEYDAPNAGYMCPCCGSREVFRSPFIECDCGATVYLGHGDTECDECGQAYNAFGDKITHMGFTEDDF